MLSRQTDRTRRSIKGTISLTTWWTKTAMELRTPSIGRKESRDSDYCPTQPTSKATTQTCQTNRVVNRMPKTWPQPDLSSAEESVLCGQSGCKTQICSSRTWICRAWTWARRQPKGPRNSSCTERPRKTRAVWLAPIISSGSTSLGWASAVKSRPSFILRQKVRGDIPKSKVIPSYFVSQLLYSKLWSI